MRLFVLISVLATAVHGETTSLNTPLTPDKETTITCELTVAPKGGEVPVLDSENSRCLGTYHYKLYLPASYNKDPQRRYPCLFIMSPGGGASMGKLSSWLKEHEYVVVSLVEARNGPWEPIVGNFLAAHDDVVKRVRIQEGLKMATGFSGGARGSSVFVQIRPGFCGLIMQGAGAAQDKGQYKVAGVKRNPAISCVLLMGNQDGNRAEVAPLRAALSGNKYLYLPYEGGHTAPPIELLEQAFTWVENNVYEDGPAIPSLRPVYLQRFNAQYDKSRAATKPLDRLKFADAAVSFATNRGLGTDPTVAGKMRELQAESARLRADPSLAREAQAYDALRRLEQNRSKIQESRFVTECQNLSRMYAGTEAAARARQLAEGEKQ